jgi:hypothetical protein
MQHRILTSAAARLGLGGTAAAIETQPPAPTGLPAPAAQTGAEEMVDVVTLADANAAVATARTEGAAAERERTAAVLNSDAGKANPSTAAFLLNTSPSASADQIIGHMALMPAPAAAAPAPAPVVEEAPKAITNPLEQTPKMNVQPNANVGGASEEEDVTKGWDTAIASASVSERTMLAGGIPRTGN